MRVTSPKEIGEAINRKRKQDGLTLEQASALCGVSYKFLSSLENGKPSVRLDKILQVMSCLGLQFEINAKGWDD